MTTSSFSAEVSDGIPRVTTTRKQIKNNILGELERKTDEAQYITRLLNSTYIVTRTYYRNAKIEEQE